MRIALCSDEPARVHDTIRAELERRGHTIVPFGAILSGQDEPWAEVAERAAEAVAAGSCDQGVFLCWTGTGISMSANKVAGVRAALCADPGTAAGARTWNDANVLCLSNRTLSDGIAKEILAAWFDTPAGDPASTGADRLIAVDARHRK